MATNVIKGDLIVLDLGSAGGGQLQVGTGGNDDKVFLEGFNRDGTGHASELLITGRFAKPLPAFTVLADAMLHQGRIFSFDLGPNGGGRFVIGNNLNDNRIFLQGSAPEMLITGASAQPLQLFAVLANTARFSGDIETTGDIRLNNADCAEDFDICNADQVEPGTVMILGEDGRLEQSQKAYDKRVAGVVSGAGNYKPGIILDKQQSQTGRKPIALLGKVFCKVDAQYGAIEVGDLLTTAHTPGHAMKATDPFKAFGTVIGKALRPLAEGRGLVPILIALQ